MFKGSYGTYSAPTHTSKKSLAFYFGHGSSACAYFQPRASVHMLSTPRARPLQMEVQERCGPHIKLAIV